MKIIKKIADDLFDWLIFLGLCLIGVGLFLLWGLPIAMLGVGALILIIGLYGAGMGRPVRQGKK